MNYSSFFSKISHYANGSKGLSIARGELAIVKRGNSFACPNDARGRTEVARARTELSIARPKLTIVKRGNAIACAEDAMACGGNAMGRGGNAEACPEDSEGRI